MEHTDLTSPSRSSARMLISVRSMFPLDTIPDALTVDEYKVTVELRQFLEAQTHVMLISDISDVDLDTGAVYATLRLQPKSAGAGKVVITNLKKDEASTVRQLISGLMLAEERSIDLSLVGDADLYSQVLACGRTAS